MAKDWIMVRISRDTHRELERVRQSMLRAELMGLAQLKKDARGRFPLDEVILRLIDMRDKHAARVRRSKSRKRKGKCNGETETAQLPTPPREDSAGGSAPVAESAPLEGTL
jgi:hypothetical protein